MLFTDDPSIKPANVFHDLLAPETPRKRFRPTEVEKGNEDEDDQVNDSAKRPEEHGMAKRLRSYEVYHSYLH